MAQLVTLSEIITRVLERAGLEYSAPGSTSAEEHARLVNSQYKRLYNMLVDARGAEYYALATTFTTAAGTGVYPLEADTGSGGCGMPRFYELLSIHLRADSNIRRLKQWEYAELDALMRLDFYGSRHWSQIRYRVTDKNLEFMPTPNGAYTIYLRYIPTAPKLVLTTPVDDSESETLDGVNGFEDWVVLSSALALREKLEMDVAGILGERQKIEAEIDALKSKRNAADAPRIISRGNAWSLNNFPIPHGFADTDDHGW